MKKIAQNSATQTKMFGHFSPVFHLPAAINSAEHISLCLFGTVYVKFQNCSEQNFLSSSNEGTLDSSLESVCSSCGIYRQQEEVLFP